MKAEFKSRTAGGKEVLQVKLTGEELVDAFRGRWMKETLVHQLVYIEVPVNCNKAQNLSGNLHETGCRAARSKGSKTDPLFL